jgi:hypothetical protein
MNATWRTLGALCRELDWSPRRLLHELQGGLPYRTIPEGHVIDWHDPNVRRWLNVEASEVSFYDEKVAKERSQGIVISLGLVTYGVEVLPPDAPPAPAPTPPPSVSQTPPPLRKVSVADVERCLRNIMNERPNDPPSEDELFAEMRQRLGASPGRNRLRQLRREIAPQWKRPRGHPRNFNSANKSAV